MSNSIIRNNSDGNLGITVGDLIFPMLYIYYKGNSKYKRLIGDDDKFNNGLRDGIKSMLSSSIPQDNKKEQEDIIIKDITDNVSRYHHMFTSAVSKNKMALWGMNNAINSLMSKYNSRLPHIKGIYYKSTNKEKISYSPILDSSDPNNLYNMMECLRLLFENNLLPGEYNLGTRPMLLSTGDFVTVANDNIGEQKLNRLIGMPKIGQFSLNTRKMKPILGRTFSGTDMKTMVTLNETVTMLQTMTALSWSVHRAKPGGRPLGRPGPRGRASQSRTIAGTMIFAAADHEPLLDIIPEEVPSRRLDQMGWNDKPYKTIMLPDQLPPFDIMVIMKNEYGSAAILSLYGVEIVDYGSQMDVNNLMQEYVYQYVASGMDPLVEAYADENGYFDPYGLLQGGYSEMWFRREIAMEGLLHSDLEQTYRDHLISVNREALSSNGIVVEITPKY